MRNYYLSNTSDIPIYQQLYNQIVGQILSHELESNQLLPSIRTMAKELRVSVITIKKTWEELEKNGYIYTIASKGSYVSENTKKDIQKKKDDTIRSLLKETIEKSKELNISKEEIIKIVEEMY